MSSASLVEGRRLGPGKASPSHGGGVEAVLASLTESVSVHRERHAPVSGRFATGASEARSSSCVGSDQNAPTVRSRSAEAIVGVVKRPGLR